MIDQERVRAVVDAYVDSYRGNDKQACLDLFAPDAVWHDPVGEPPHVGHQGSARSGINRTRLPSRSCSNRRT